MFFEQFVDKVSFTDHISAIFTLIGALYFIYEKVSTIVKEETTLVIKNHLNRSTDVKAYIEDIEQKINNYPTPSLYKLFLSDILGFLDKNLGELKFFCYKAFDKYLIYSLIYSFLFFYFSWLFGGDGKIGINYLWINGDRVLLSFFIIYEILILYYSINYISKYYKKFTKFLRKVVIVVVSLLSLFLIGVVAVKIEGSILISIFIFLGMTYVLLGGIEVLKMLGMFIILALMNIKISGQSIFFILFFAVLPFINSIFDYISMYFSRLFAQNILHTDSKFKVFIDVVLDIVVAVLLLVSLAFVLYEVIDFVNIYVIKKESLYIPIEIYKEQIFKNPFGKDVLWIMMMFITTLIPTLLHILLAIFSFFAFFVTKPHLHTLINQLKSFNDKDFESHAYLEKEKIAKSLVLRYRLVGNIRGYLFMATVLASVLFVVGLMFLYRIGLL